MRSFEQKSSIIRRLTLLAFGLFCFFLFDFAATYWTSHQLVKGLQSIHELNRVFELTTLAEHDIAAAADSLRGAPTAADTREVASVFSVNQQQAIRRLRALVALESHDPEGRELVEAALTSVAALERHAGELFRDLRIQNPRRRLTESQSDLVVLHQFELEAKDAMRKLQLRLKRQSDDEFNRVYRTRNYPQLAILLGLMVLVVAGIQGIPLVRNLGRGMRNLLGATDIVATGNLTYEAPILRSDELGRLTHAFNRMVANLREQESRAREASEDERRRLEFLITSSDLLTRSMDIRATLEGAARGPVPYLADWCVIDLVREEGHIERVAAAHADSEHDLKLKKMILEPFRIEETDNPITRVLKSGKPEVVSEATEEPLKEGSSYRRETYQVFGLRSYMSVPIVAGSKKLGVISFVSSRPGLRYSGSHLALAQEYGRRAGLAIDHAILLEAERAAVKTRDEFLSIASHELRTPLTPLSMQLQQVKRMLSRPGGVVPPDRLNRMLDTSDRMVKRLAGLVDDLLDVSRINVGKLTLRFEDFDLVEMVGEVLERFKHALEQVHSPVTLKGIERLDGRWDRARMEQVLTNLLTNAMRYGGGKTIEVLVERQGDQAVLCVRDQGIGIALEDQVRIFRRFERASPASHYGGLGLGLFITTQLLDLQGGKISVESELGRGSTFTVQVPIRPTPGLEKTA